MSQVHEFTPVFAALTQEQQQQFIESVEQNPSDASALTLAGDVAFARKVWDRMSEGARYVWLFQHSRAQGNLPREAEQVAHNTVTGKPKGAPRKARKTSVSSGDKTPATSANAPITLPSVRIDTALLWHSSNANHAHWTGTVAGVKVTDAPYTFAKGAYADRYVPKTAKIVLTMAFAKQLLECAGDAGKIDALDAKVAKHLGARNARVFVGQRANREWLEAALEDIEVARKG